MLLEDVAGAARAAVGSKKDGEVAADTVDGLLPGVKAWISGKPIAEIETALYDDAHARAADLDQLGQIASSFRSRRHFLTELTLDPPDSTAGNIQPVPKDEDPLVLSTIHSAKGLEWRNVYVLNVIEGCIPFLNAESAAEIEEERRLLHVAIYMWR